MSNERAADAREGSAFVKHALTVFAAISRRIKFKNDLPLQLRVGGEQYYCLSGTAEYSLNCVFSELTFCRRSSVSQGIE